jgi:glucan 1,3-beta-glucosidase
VGPAGTATASGEAAESGYEVARGNLSQLAIDGTRWVDAEGRQVHLKGTNLGNWLVQEFWMMDQGGHGVHDQCTLEAELTRRFGYREKERLIRLFRDSWIGSRDWDILKSFGFNVVRLPILWSVVEDERNHKRLRADAWQIIDGAIAEAKKRGMWVILDLHGAPGGQTPNDHTGCSGQNKYWTTPEYQERTRWWWQQVAARYKDEPAVAAFDPLNEPWGSSAEQMEERVTELYHTIRAIDPTHIVLLPGHYGNIDVYGNPARRGMTNVAFELHPYPGLFGDRPGDRHLDIHRDWLTCGRSGDGGVCALNAKLRVLDAAMLMGEFQPWQGAGLELGGKLGRATYDAYASYGWAATSWSYKVVTLRGGQGKGTWGMVTNEARSVIDRSVVQLAKASTWDCPGWNSELSRACARNAEAFSVPGAGTHRYHLVLKNGAAAGGKLDVSYDELRLLEVATGEDVLTNGGFGSSSGWAEVSIGGSLRYDYASMRPDRAPTGSKGPALHVTASADKREANGLVYREVTLRGGQSYHLHGVFRDNSSTNAWAEIYLVDHPPRAGEDIVDREGRLDFTQAPLEQIEALFRSYGEVGYDVHAGLSKWLVTQERNNVFD